MKTSTNNRYVEEYLSYISTIKGLSDKTVEVYRGDLFAFLNYIVATTKANDGVEQISIEDLENVEYNTAVNFLSYQVKKHNNSEVTRKRKTAAIKEFYKYLVSKQRYFKYNPVADLETPKCPSRKAKYLQLDEAMDLLKGIKGRHAVRDYAIIAVFLNCGLRLSELTNIKLKDLKGDRLRVIGKGDKERTVFLNDACLKAVQDYMQIRESDSPYLFISAQKKPIANRTVQDLVKKHLANAGLNIDELSVHKLRHTAATLMFQYGGADVLTIKEILGHENVSTTQVYTHVDSSQIRDTQRSHPLSEFEGGR
jgi:site-specific recombinase XerD